MNRRGFLSLFGAAASAIALPEVRRVYSYPSTAWLAASGRRATYRLEDLEIRIGARYFSGIAVGPVDQGDFVHIVPDDIRGLDYVKRAVETSLRRQVERGTLSPKMLPFVKISGKLST